MPPVVGPEASSPRRVRPASGRAAVARSEVEQGHGEAAGRRQRVGGFCQEVRRAVRRRCSSSHG
eukprot:4275026-Lingulodinium_polyedra.AAC.1